MLWARVCASANELQPDLTVVASLQMFSLPFQETVVLRSYSSRGEGGLAITNDILGLSYEKLALLYDSCVYLVLIVLSCVSCVDLHKLF